MARKENKTGLWKGFTRPVWRDKAAWFALLVAAAIVLVQTPFWDLSNMTFGRWATLVITVGLSVAIGFALVGTVVGFFRGFKIGVIQGMEERPKDLEHRARSVGRMVSRLRPKR